MDCDPVGKESLASAGLRVVTGLVEASMSLTRTDGCPLLPAAGFPGASEMSARVGMSGSEGKPAVETK